MAKKRPSSRAKKPASPSPGKAVALQWLASAGAWILTHPRCARDRAEDIEEVRMMVDAGELDVAQDELRWLLAGCTDFMEGHLLLGEVAVQSGNDMALARGHFGYAYQLGLKAWHRAGEPVPVPYAQLSNRPFHEAGRGLAWCLEKLGKPAMADEVASVLCRMDEADVLEVRQMLRDLRNNGMLPIL